MWFFAISSYELTQPCVPRIHPTLARLSSPACRLSILSSRRSILGSICWMSSNCFVVAASAALTSRDLLSQDSEILSEIGFLLYCWLQLMVLPTIMWEQLQT